MTATNTITTRNNSSTTNTDAINPVAASHQLSVMYQYAIEVNASMIFITIILVI